MKHYFTKEGKHLGSVEIGEIIFNEPPIIKEDNELYSYEIELFENQIRETDNSIKKRLIGKIQSFSSYLKTKISGNPDFIDIASWSTKELRAKAIISGNASKEDKDIMQLECDNRKKGESIEELSNRIIFLSNLFYKTESIIQGIKDNYFNKIKNEFNREWGDEFINSFIKEVEDKLVENDIITNEMRIYRAFYK